MAVRQTINQLTATVVKTAAKPGKYADGLGLYLRVVETATGISKSWVFRYRLHGKQRDLGMGTPDTFNLAEARDRARKCRQMVAEGSDPIEHYRQFRQPKAPSKDTPTYAQAAQKYIDAKRAGWHPRHAKQWDANLRNYCRPIAELSVDAINAEDIAKCLIRDWLTKPETTDRVRQQIERVLDAAAADGWRSKENPARWKGSMEGKLPDRPRGRKAVPRAALPYADAPAFTTELREKAGFSPRALELQILTAVRPGEAAGARWDEIDLDAAAWTIPGSRMKMGEDHRVPLSTQAVAMLRAMPRLVGNPEFVFPGDKKHRPLTTAAAMKVLKSIRSGITAHGFRSTFRTWCAEVARCPRDIAEAALAHTIEGVEGDYNRAEFFAIRAKLMQQWADYCDGKADAS